MSIALSIALLSLAAGGAPIRAGEAPAAEAPEPEPDRPAMTPEAGTSTLSPDEEITPALRRAAERGLAYLAETQSRDGGWGSGGRGIHRSSTLAGAGGGGSTSGGGGGGAPKGKV